mgnify:CR=1 FL=1
MELVCLSRSASRMPGVNFSLRDFLEKREQRRLDEMYGNGNLIEYQFDEDSETNFITVKDPNQNIPRSMWGAPVTVFTEGKSESTYRGTNLKTLHHTTKGNKVMELLFRVA